ncbi:MAG: DNA-binding protein WhiA [Oscillospiraceae bacterium]|nr:DNA-binding protein WhiA [Oscillospiraceae bacterium]
MSFAADVKNELTRQQTSSKCCASAECYGVLMFCNSFTKDGIRIVTECRPFFRRLPKLFRRAFGVQFDELPRDEGAGKVTLAITDREKIAKIMDFIGVSPEALLAHHINFGVLEEDCCRQSFMRGAFFAGGSVTDPQKRYHLELVTDHYHVSREAVSLLHEMGFEPKTTQRGGNYIIYFKNSGAIEDFLTTVGAPVSAMEIMSAKIMKDMTNSVNRQVNCDTANVTKTVEAAQEQIEAIAVLRKTGALASLPEKLRETARLREENPELPLSQLAALCDPPVTKSCLNHRLKRLTELAKA